MTNSNERLDRIEGILDRVATGQESIHKILEEMAARQRYHDEAFERFDADMKLMKEAQAVDAQHIRALVRVAELHSQRLEGLEDAPGA